jgi:hypothetical protein
VRRRAAAIDKNSTLAMERGQASGAARSGAKIFGFA